jgi:hypothetical protein
MLECFSRLTPNWINRAYVYQGSVGPFGNDFRFRLAHDEANGVIHAATYSKVCYELAQDVLEQDFSWDDAGVEELKQWLQAQYTSYAAAHGLPTEEA